MADGLDESPAGAIFVERSSFRGRCREPLGREGEEGGSFFTIILGALPELRALEDVRHVQTPENRAVKRLTLSETAYHPSGFFARLDRLVKLLRRGLR